MERLARPRWADSDEPGPEKGDQDGSEHDAVGPVGMIDRLERGGRVGGAGDPFAVEAERDGEGDYGCEVDGEDGDAEDEKTASASDGNMEVRGRSHHLVFHCLLERCLKV